MLKPYTAGLLTFEKIEEIGAEGKNSKVHLVHDHQLDAKLAMKSIDKKKIKDPALYFKEASILYQSEHPNVMPVHYACEDSDNIFIAMPYMEKGSLNAKIKERNLTVAEIIRYSFQFLSGLHNIHSKGLLHFDIKPDNILLSKRDEALVSDFGLARRMDGGGLAQADSFYPKIVPPELIKGEKQFDVRYDIYHVGCTLYRMCVGNDEFDRQWKSFFKMGKLRDSDYADAVVEGRFPDRKKFPEHIPLTLQRTITKCLEPDPDKRFSSVLEILNSLANIEGPELDWQYSIDEDGTKKWSKNVEGSERYLKITPDGVATAEKQNVRGRYTKVTNYCGRINSKAVKDFLKDKK